MSWQKQDDDCPGCRPVITDLNLKPVPDDDPVQVAVNAIWSKTTLEERQAFHRFTCQNSRTSADLKVVNDIRIRIQTALAN